MYFRFIVAVSFLSFLADLRVTGCDYTCRDKPKFTPSKVVVKYGDPINATCTVCSNCTTDFTGLEASLGKKTNGSEISWTVDKMTEWEITPPKCYYININNTQCCKALDVVVYQPTENVSISFVNHTGPMREDDEYTLRCDVLQVAPVKNLIVTFYKGQTALLHLKSTDNTTAEPVDANFTLNFNSTREDIGAEFWCEAKLELGPEGPQPPLVVKSGKLTAMVHYKPELEGPSVRNIDIRRGETIHLNCSADGNPPPSYTWTIPFDNFSYNNSVFTVESVGFGHKGEYICNVSNSLGSSVVKFNVTVAFGDIILMIIGLLIGVTLSVFGGLTAYKCYKQHRMGHYSLKDVFHFKRQHTQIPLR